jgi:hypothetical protein
VALSQRQLMSFCCALLSIVLSSGGVASAQAGAAAVSGQNSHPPANINTPHQLIIAGCLRRDSAGTYSLTGDTGKTWNLIPGSDDVDLSKHVFHAVRITGKEAPAAKPPDAADNSQAQSPPPSVLRVLTLEVLSNSCTR